jgi:nitrogen-specific signal transduction histidine kinase
VKEHLFEPQVSTREEGGGFGLWVSHQIVTQLGGGMEVDSGRHGTEFKVVIPLLETDNDDNRSPTRNIAS